MKRSRFTDSQIIAILKQAEGGSPVPELCREHGISSATFYKWRAKFGGMDASLMARLAHAIVHRDIHTLVAEVVRHGQAFDEPSRAQTVTDKIHAQDLIDRRGDLQRVALAHRSLAL